MGATRGPSTADRLHRGVANVVVLEDAVRLVPAPSGDRTVEFGAGRAPDDDLLAIRIGEAHSQARLAQLASREKGAGCRAIGGADVYSAPSCKSEVADGARAHRARIGWVANRDGRIREAMVAVKVGAIPRIAVAIGSCIAARAMEISALLYFRHVRRSSASVRVARGARLPQRRGGRGQQQQQRHHVLSQRAAD